MRNDEEIKNLAENLIFIRKICRLSQEEMAKVIGLERRQLETLERAELSDDIMVDFLFDIEKIFTIPVFELFSKEDIPFKSFFTRCQEENPILDS